MGKTSLGTKMKGKKKFIVIAIIAIIAVLVGFKFLGAKEVEKPTVTLDTVESRDIEQIVSLKSTIEGETNFEVFSILNLEVMKILVAEGDKVEKGQILAELDRSSINDEIVSATKRLELSKLNLEESLKTAQKQYDDALRNLEESNRKLELNKELFAAEAISQEELKQFELSVERDQTAINAFDAVNGKVVANAAQKKAIEVEQQTLDTLKKKLDDTYIKSTASGTVTRVNIKVGSLATDTEERKAMFIIEDLENLKMTVKASEYDISKIKEGQTVKVYAEILGNDYVTGVVKKILPTGEKKDAASSEMVIPVEIKVDNLDDRLMTGITARADIIVKESKSVPSIMIDSVVKDMSANESKVYIVNELNQVEILTITTGAEDDFFVEITSGNVNAGDKVISSPSYELIEGLEVTIEEIPTVTDGEIVTEG